MLIVGAVLSTVNNPLVAAGALLPDPSVAVLAAMVMPIVPFPLIPETVIVGVLVVPPVTFTVVAAAVPVVFNVIFALLRLTVVAPMYVAVKVTGPVLVTAGEGAAMLSEGPVLFTVTVVVSVAESAVLPARSEAVLAAIARVNVPFPVSDEILTFFVVAVSAKTVIVPVTPPVAVSDTLPLAKEIVSAPP